MTTERQKQKWPFSFLFNSSSSMRRYILTAGLISLIPSLIVAVILAGLGVLNEETSPDFEGPTLFLLIGVIIVGPAVETLLMGPVLWVLSCVVKRRILLAVTSALIWAGLHSLVAPPWGLVVFWPFFVFSCSYITWRQRAWWRAVWVTSCIHAFQNFLPGLLVGLSSWAIS